MMRRENSSCKYLGLSDGKLFAENNSEKKVIILKFSFQIQVNRICSSISYRDSNYKIQSGFFVKYYQLKPDFLILFGLLTFRISQNL